MAKRQAKPNLAALYRVVEAQAGYFTARQAIRAGFSSKLLWHYKESEKLLQVAHGVYRLAQFPASPLEDLFVAWLRCGSKAVISHESALAIYDLSDVMLAACWTGGHLRVFTSTSASGIPSRRLLKSLRVLTCWISPASSQQKLGSTL